MNRTLLDECFRVQGRTKWYTEPDEIQRDLDVFMAFYNFRRTHQGYRVRGRTPANALYDLIAEQWLLPPISDPAERWRASGLSAAEFATEIGVNARTLTYWKWKLGQRGPEADARRAEFVEVLAPEASAALAPLEIVVGDRVVVRVPARFDADALRKVVAALGGA